MERALNKIGDLYKDRVLWSVQETNERFGLKESHWQQSRGWENMVKLFLQLPRSAPRCGKYENLRLIWQKDCVTFRQIHGHSDRNRVVHEGCLR